MNETQVIQVRKNGIYPLLDGGYGVIIADKFVKHFETVNSALSEFPEIKHQSHGWTLDRSI